MILFRLFLVVLALVIMLGAYVRLVDLGVPALWLDGILHLQVRRTWTEIGLTVPLSAGAEKPRSASKDAHKGAARSSSAHSPRCQRGKIRSIATELVPQTGETASNGSDRLMGDGERQMAVEEL